jgi:hypothetical protein
MGYRSEESFHPAKDTGSPASWKERSRPSAQRGADG